MFESKQRKAPNYFLPPVNPPNMQYLIPPTFDEHLMLFNPKTGDLYFWPEGWIGNPQDWLKQK